MREISQRTRKNCADRKCGSGLFDDVEFLENSRKSRHCKSDRVIQEELRGVDNPRILYCLQHAVNRTDDNTFSYAEHIRKQHKRKHRRKGYRAALRQREKLYVRKRERKRDGNCGIRHLTRGERTVAFRENGCGDDKDKNKHDCADIKPCLRHAFVISADFFEVHRQKRNTHNHGD